MCALYLERLHVHKHEYVLGVGGDYMEVTWFCSENGINIDEIQSFTKNKTLAGWNIPTTWYTMKELPMYVKVITITDTHLLWVHFQSKSSSFYYLWVLLFFLAVHWSLLASATNMVLTTVFSDTSSDWVMHTENEIVFLSFLSCLNLNSFCFLTVTS